MRENGTVNYRYSQGVAYMVRVIPVHRYVSSCFCKTTDGQKPLLARTIIVRAQCYIPVTITPDKDSCQRDIRLSLVPIVTHDPPRRSKPSFLG